MRETGTAFNVKITTTTATARTTDMSRHGFPHTSSPPCIIHTSSCRQARDFHRRLTKAWENGSLVPPPAPAAPPAAGAEGASAAAPEGLSATDTGDADDGGDEDKDGVTGYVEGEGEGDGATAQEGGDGGADAACSGGGTGLRRRGGRNGSSGQAPGGEAVVAAAAEPEETSAAVPHPGPLPDNIFDNGMWAVRFRCCCGRRLVGSRGWRLSTSMT